MEQVGEGPAEVRPLGEVAGALPTTGVAAEAASVPPADEAPLEVEAVEQGPLDERGRTPAERARLREEIIARSHMSPAERRRRAANSAHIKTLLERMAWRRPTPPDTTE